MARLLSVALSALLLLPAHAVAQGPMEGGAGGPMGGGMMHREPTIPSSLPRPSDQWLTQLTEVLAIEEHSQRQYEADSAKYSAPMPYRMVLNQEADHIRWIRALYAAYGVTPSPASLPLRPTSSLNEALEIGRSIESDLVVRYEQLHGSSNDPASRDVLGMIGQQTHHHLMMFLHALRGGMGAGGMRGNPM